MRVLRRDTNCYIRGSNLHILLPSLSHSLIRPLIGVAIALFPRGRPIITGFSAQKWVSELSKREKRGFHPRTNIHTGHKIKICLDRAVENGVLYCSIETDFYFMPRMYVSSGVKPPKNRFIPTRQYGIYITGYMTGYTGVLYGIYRNTYAEGARSKFGLIVIVTVDVIVIRKYVRTLTITSPVGEVHTTTATQNTQRTDKR